MGEFRDPITIPAPTTFYKINLESETADEDYQGEDPKKDIEEKNITPPPKLQQSIDEVFDKYVEKVDQSYGQIIKDNKILKILVYPTMVILHTIMVTDNKHFKEISEAAPVKYCP